MEMISKNKKRFKFIIAIIFTITILMSRTVLVMADDELQDSSSKTYSTQIELNTTSLESSEGVEASKLKITDITENSSAVVDLYNLGAENRISVQADGTFTNSGEGVIISLSNLKQDQNYRIKIEEIVTVRDDTSTNDVETTEGGETMGNNETTEGNGTTEYKEILLNSVVLNILVDDDENIVAQVMEVVNNDDNNKPESLLKRVMARLRGANSNGTVKINPNENDPDATYRYKIGEDGEWKNYTEEFKVYENTTVYAQASKNGTDSSVSLKIINNIDKVLPQMLSYEEINENNERHSSVNMKLTDDVLGTGHASGIAKYGISTSNTQKPDECIIANNELEIDATVDEVYENGVHYVWIWDSAGNYSIDSINIEKVNMINVAKITAASVGYENLIGTEYKTLKAAIAACPTEENSNATITILAEIFNENNVIDNRNITLNLNGNVITSKSSDSPAITINDGASLTVINEDENEVVLNSGSITSKNYTGILVNEGGTLTLGKNDKKVRVSQPAIAGKENGVKNEGTFNFYDGNVTATSQDLESSVLAIYGRVTDTPVAYSISTDDTKTETEVKQVSTPTIMDEIEARIGRKTYTKLENAILDAGESFGRDGSQVEVVIVKNLNKEETVVIDADKNIKLDLDGHTFTTSSSGYVLENYGELEIVDTSEEQTGEIVSSTNSVVYNGTNAFQGEPTAIDLSTVKNAASNMSNYQYQDGVLLGYDSNNSGYFEIDLSDYENKYYMICIEEEYTDGHGGIAYVLNNEGQNTSYSNRVQPGNITLFAKGGEKIYLTLNCWRASRWYQADNKIKSITIGKADTGKLTLTSGKITLNKAGASSSYTGGTYYYGVVNEAEMVVNGTKATIESNKQITGCIYNKTSGKLSIAEGTLKGDTTSYYSVAVRTQSTNYGTSSETYISGGNYTASCGFFCYGNGAHSEFTGGNFECKNYIVYNQLGSTADVSCNMSIGDNYSTIKNDGGEINVHDCQITKTTTSGYGIENNSGTAQITNCKITSSGTAIYNWGTCNIRNCNEISGHYYQSITNETSGRMTIENSKIYASPEELRYNSVCAINNKGTLEINSNSQITATNDYCIKNANNKLTINNTTITSSLSSINVTGGTIELNNATLSSEKSAIIIAGATTININDNSTFTTRETAIYSTVSDINVNMNIKDSTIESTSAQAINMANVLGTITLGEKEGEVTQTPVIKSGISESGITAYNMKLRFYDGKIMGTENGTIIVPIEELEDNMELISNINEGYQEITLGIPQEGIEANYVAEVVETGNKYVTLQKAINGCGNSENQRTIRLLKKVNLGTKNMVSQGQNIKIDLNGNIVLAYGNETFYNEGNLEIVDSVMAQSVDGEDTQPTEPLIQTKCNIFTIAGAKLVKNTMPEGAETATNAELKIGNGIKIEAVLLGTNQNQKELIDNGAKLTIDNASIYARNSAKYARCVSNSGELSIINNSTIKLGNQVNYLSAIYNTSNAEIEDINIEVGEQSNNSKIIYNKSNATINNLIMTIYKDMYSTSRNL